MRAPIIKVPIGMIAFHTVIFAPSAGATSSNPMTAFSFSSFSRPLRALFSASFIGPNSYNVNAEIIMNIKIKIL